MTKTELIQAYNDLTPELKELVKNYMELTGNVWFGYTDNIKSASYYSKKDVEEELRSRTSMMSIIKEEIKSFTENKKFIATDEGKAFIADLYNKQNEFVKTCESIRTKAAEAFNEILSEIGLNWEIDKWGVERIFDPEYVHFDIQDKTERWNKLSVTIARNRRTNNYTIELGSSVSGGSDICNPNDMQYIRFKTYVRICDNHEKFMKYISETYVPMKKSYSEILKEIEDLGIMLGCPYKFYNK